MPSRLFHFVTVAAIALIAAGCANTSGPAPNEQIFFAFGTVTDENGVGVEGVELYADGHAGIAETDENGRWSLGGLQGNTVITPAKDGWYFNPPQVTVNFQNREGYFEALRSGSTIVLQARLNGPEATYPLQDAVVTIAGRSARTNASGQAFVHHLNADEPVNWVVETDFAIYGGFETSPRDITVLADLPPDITDAHFRDGIFYRDRNDRWERGETITVYFDYDAVLGLTDMQRRQFEEDVLREFASWFEGVDFVNPVLRWGGKVHHELDANVIIRLVDDERFLVRFPEYADREQLPPSVRVPRSHNGYTVLVEYWVRMDGLNPRPGTYARWLGRILGLGTINSATAPEESVMRTSHRAGEATDLDRLMLAIKMHLPPQIPYSDAD